MGRNTQGVKVINLKNNDSIAAIAKVEMDKDVEEVEETENPEAELPGAVDAVLPEFKDAPQTGDNAISNMGDAEYLKKIEEQEAEENKKIEMKMIPRNQNRPKRFF